VCLVETGLKPVSTSSNDCSPLLILIRIQTLNKYAILPLEIKTLKGGHSHETYRCSWPFETGRDKGANAIFRKSPAISAMASNLYYSSKRLKAEAVSELVGVCTGTVHQWVHQYKHKGPDVFILQGRGGRRRELLSWNEEEELLEVFFQDEARFGRMSNPARCWAPAGFHPIVPMQRVREYT